MLAKMWRNWNSHVLLWKYKMVQQHWKTVYGSFKLNIHLPHDLETSLLDIYLSEMIIFP